MTEIELADVPTLLERLGQPALRGRPALTFYQGRRLVGRLSYGELLQQVQRMAAYLREGEGVRRGDRVALVSPNRLEVPVLLLSAMRLGATVVPLNPAAPPQDWAYILAHCAPRALFASKELLEGAGAGALRSALPLEDLPRRGAAPPLPPGGGDALAEERAIVLYTSGTTGDPKGVALSQRNLLANAQSMARCFGLDGTTQLAVLPLYHAHALGFGLMTALLTGGHLVFTDRLDPFAWAEIVRAEAVSVTSVVPTLLPLLLQGRVSREQVPTLRAVLVSSAPLSVELARTFLDRSEIPLVQGWGLSEYTNFACCQRPDEDPAALREQLLGFDHPAIGAPLPGAEVRVADAQGAELPEGVRGELWVRGPSLMLGYYRDPEATRRTTADGWLRTGDQGLFRLHRGRPLFFVTGRLKEIIIRGGEKYSPLAVERRIAAAVPEIDGRLVVLGFPHRVHGEEIGAYLEAGGPAEEAGRQGEIERRLLRAIGEMPPDLRPKIILRGAAPIPRTHTGKIQRRRLQDLFSPYQDCKGAPRIV